MNARMLLSSSKTLLWFLLAFSLPWVSGFGAPRLQSTGLRCEYLIHPTAIDQTQPRLSWVVDAGKNRGVLQSAYQILVASSVDLLARGQGDLWDSGKTISDQSIQVVYQGHPLVSWETYFWKVKLWDERGSASPWSEPAQWTMGPLKPSDWQAKWIGYDGVADDQPASEVMKPLLQLEDQKWFWAAGSQPGDQPPGKVYFRKVIDLPPGRPIKQATFLIAADDSFNLFVNGHSSGQGSNFRDPSTPDITGRLQPGPNALGIEVTNGGDHPNPAGLLGRLVILFQNSEPMVVPIDATWQTSRQASPRWNWSDFDAGNWQPAAEVAKFGDEPWGKPEVNIVTMMPAPFFRKAFTVHKSIKRAMVFASALGVYELHLNGKPVNTDALSPGWTDYSKRVHYLGYDVTRCLRKGENVLGAILGDGWYAGYLAFTGRRHYYGEKPRLLAQMEIEYQDGSRETLGTDETWKATMGPIVEDDLLMGCVYDARKEVPGWDTPGCSDANWHIAKVDSSIHANLEAHPGAPIRRIMALRPKEITEPQPGVYVFDLGQNMVGWARLKASGQVGQKVTVRHAEMLNPDGTIYTTNLRAARATDTFYLAGEVKRPYEPYFTFHGFRYVEVTGLNYKPELGDLTGIVVSSDLARTGWFECSEPLVTRLALNSLWGQRGNFLDVSTDCPQRDERAGWTGDAQVFMKTACFNLDAPAFYTKWLVDLCQDSQRDDGAFGDVAPHINIVGYGNTGWSDSGPVCNWRMYEMYGDERVLAKHYDTLARHMDYLQKTSTNFVRGTGAYGDWLRLSGPQHSEVSGTAYYYYATTLMARIAAVLGKNEDAEKYRGLAHNIQTTFVRNFIKDDGQILDGGNETGQTFYALAFGLDLVPPEMKEKVAAQFVAALKKENDHLATGFLGTPFVLFALQKAGHPELAYKVVLNKTYPSWLQQVIWGSTTMWERWDGWRPDKGFQDPGMNSFNHYWLGCVTEWLFTQAAGIDTDGPGFKRIKIHPDIVNAADGFDWVKASYNSIRGHISTDWRIKDGVFQIKVSVPGNCLATVYLPAKNAATVTENGHAAARAKGVKFLRQEGGLALFEIGSGDYDFQNRL